MNKKQLSECIGNLDEKLVWQAEQIPNYAVSYRRKRMSRILCVAAAIALMVCSFGAGRFVSAHKTEIKEVMVEHETVNLDEIGLTMVLPDNWKGTYSVEKNDKNYIVYNKQIREAVSKGNDAFDGGVLFTIVCYDEAMTPEEFEKKGYDFTAYRYLFSTRENTYILYFASDVQWNTNDPKQEAIYNQMEFEIKDIRFVVNHVLLD